MCCRELPGRIVDISKAVCISSDGRALPTPDKVYVDGRNVVVIEECEAIDIDEINQLAKAMDALKNGYCTNVQIHVENKRVVGVVHGKRVRNGTIMLRYLESISRKMPIHIARCHNELYELVSKIVSV